MPKLSAARQTIDISLSGGCKVTVYTSLTVADQRALEKEYGNLLAISPEKQSDYAIAMVMKLIKGWDMTDDDDKPLAPSPEALEKIPQLDMKSILEAATPGKKD
jgi:hypothetical protein